MADYKEMYLKMVRAARDAQECCAQAEQILIKAMQVCEELYISEPDGVVLSFPTENPDSKYRTP